MGFICPGLDQPLTEINIFAFPTLVSQRQIKNTVFNPQLVESTNVKGQVELTFVGLKVILRFLTALRVNALNPCVVQRSTVYNGRVMPQTQLGVLHNISHVQCIAILKSKFKFLNIYVPKNFQ